jgi:hypothetical protein
MLVHKDCIEKGADGVAMFRGPPKWLQLHNAEGVGSVPVFTDDSNALRFCEDSGFLDEAEMIDMPNGTDLANALELVHGMDGAEKVAFDPINATAVCQNVFSITYVIQELRAGRDEI